MLEGAILLWFVLAAASLLFVAIDIRTTPEAPVMKWAFMLITAFTGVIGVFLYVLGCREPFRATHERYVAAQWRQALGSTMHCVAGDGVGILAGAVIARAVKMARPAEVALEYLLGFGFGWSVFQALFMRDMVGGSYAHSLRSTFLPEFLSMNLLMAGMVPAMLILNALISGPVGPGTPVFWFVMSMALLVGFACAYPMNWWLVRHHLKHGMLTVRPRSGSPAAAPPAHADHITHGDAPGGYAMPHAAMEAEPIRPPIPVMSLLSLVTLGVGVALGLLVG